MSDPTADVLWMVRGAWVTMVLRAGCRLEVFDLLETPHTAAEVADRIDADPRATERLLRALDELGLLEEADGRYVANARGATLASGHPDGLRSLALMQSWLPNVTAWHHLDEAVSSGTSVYERVNGTPPWEHLNAHPEEEALFNRAMARRAGDQVAAVLAGADLTAATSLVDVGGGRGAMLAGLLGALPHLTGVVADRPDVAAEAESAFAQAGLGARAHGVGCDFFVSVPEGSDVYLLSNVLHDWDDHESVRILRTVRRSMRSDSRLLLVEKLLDVPGRSPAETRDLAFVDLHMLVMFGARERTLAEYDALLAEAGFGPGVVLRDPTTWDVVEYRPDVGAPATGRVTE